MTSTSGDNCDSNNTIDASSTQVTAPPTRPTHARPSAAYTPPSCCTPTPLPSSPLLPLAPAFAPLLTSDALAPVEEQHEGQKGEEDPSQCQDDRQKLSIVPYQSEAQLPDIISLVEKELSEPYSIYTYRYFIHNWPELCYLMQDGPRCVGVIICKLDTHRMRNVVRGYIAMLVVDKAYRKLGIGSRLARKALSHMRDLRAEEVVLETEVTNSGALALYENLGFLRDKRLYRYYLNGLDAFRLKLWFSR